MKLYNSTIANCEDCENAAVWKFEGIHKGDDWVRYACEDCVDSANRYACSRAIVNGLSQAMVFSEEGFKVSE